MRSARRPTRSRTCSSRTSSSRAICSAPRAGASRRSPPTATSGLRCRSRAGPERCSDNDRKRRREAVCVADSRLLSAHRCRRRGVHANYLSFMECARTELLQSLGFDLGKLARRDRVLFVVHSAQIAYHKPALLNELLTVTAQVKRVGRARLEFDQAVMRREEVLASAELSLACVSAKSYRPVAVPEAIRKKLEGLR